MREEITRLKDNNPSGGTGAPLCSCHAAARRGGQSFLQPDAQMLLLRSRAAGSREEHPACAARSGLPDTEKTMQLGCQGFSVFRENIFREGTSFFFFFLGWNLFLSIFFPFLGKMRGGNIPFSCLHGLVKTLGRTTGRFAPACKWQSHIPGELAAEKLQFR